MRYNTIIFSLDKHEFKIDWGKTMPLTILRNDLTQMDVDVIVNAANPQLLSGGGVCGAIFKAAGYQAMNEACQKQAPIQVGEAIITPGFNLKAHYVIHTVGPIYQDGLHQEKQLLEAAYRNSLELAVQNKCTSIAFPLLSSGIYGYPKSEALTIAMDVMRTFLNDHELDITLVIYDHSSFEVSKALLGDIDNYIDENQLEALERFEAVEMSRTLNYPKKLYSSIDETRNEKNVGEWILKVDEGFSPTLLKLIDQKGLSDVDVYKKANLDRKLFSKIRSNPVYAPSKRTVVALSIALELSLSETNALLEKAGYALSHSQRFDLIVEYFIVHKNYDIYQINQVLFMYDQPLLGA